MDTKFTVGEAVAAGWEKMKKHFWFFVAVLIIAWAIQFAATGIANIFQKRIFVLYVILILGAWIVQIIVRMGLIKVSLDVLDKDEEKYATLFSCVDRLGNFILGAIVYGLIVVGGLILLIVPGIIWSIKYQFFAYLIIDKNMGPLEAIKKSGEMTAGHKGKLFGLGILLCLINIVGALLLLVGLLASIPLSMVAVAYVYRKLLDEATIIEPVAAPEPAAAPIELPAAPAN